MVRPAIKNTALYLPSADDAGTVNAADELEVMLQLLRLAPNKTRQDEFRMNLEPATATTAPRWPVDGCRPVMEQASWTMTEASGRLMRITGLLVWMKMRSV
jgi:hypothetical protein